MDAANCGLATVIGAWVPVIAICGLSRHTLAIDALVIDGTEVTVETTVLIGRVHAPRFPIATIVGARIVVGAIEGHPATADPRGANLTDGAGVARGTGGPFVNRNQ